MELLVQRLQLLEDGAELYKGPHHRVVLHLTESTKGWFQGGWRLPVGRERRCKSRQTGDLFTPRDRRGDEIRTNTGEEDEDKQEEEVKGQRGLIPAGLEVCKKGEARAVGEKKVILHLMKM